MEFTFYEINLEIQNIEDKFINEKVQLELLKKCKVTNESINIL